MDATIDALRAAGVLSSLDDHMARGIGRIGGETRAEVLLAVALASRQVSAGHVCLDLPRLAQHQVLVDEAGAPVALAWPPLTDWVEAVRSSPLVSDGTHPAPLVLDSSGRLYLRRYWEHQERLAEALRTRAVQVEPTLDGPWLRATLDRLFPQDGVGRRHGERREPDWQRMAALVAVQRRLCVISGGPGTGKTSLVVKILCLLAEQALHTRRSVPRVTLLAPTGKAAARLSEAIQRLKRGLDCSPAVRHAISEDAQTIHRCLGSRRGSSTRFRHHAGNPLVTDVVVVDEASMVDLALMSRLLAATPSHARVILLGDKDQLASVEAGAVLGDICNAGGPWHHSRMLAQQIAALTGDHLPVEPQAPCDTGIWDCLVQLTHSYRYADASGIGVLARAIKAGDSAAALSVLEAVRHDDIALRPPAADGEGIVRQAVRGFAPYLRQRDWTARLRAFESFRVLCAHRGGAGGVDEVNRQIEAGLAAAGLIQPRRSYYAGRPVMVTRNDYQLDLFNGDVGLLVDAAEGDPDGSRHDDASAGDDACAARTAVGFVDPRGTVRLLSPARLPPHETVYAMSVHKSQGSEFDEVAVVFPPRLSPVVSRELLYTAVTRARRQVTIYAPRALLEQAIARPLERTSGLRDRLWPSSGPTARPQNGAK